MQKQQIREISSSLERQILKLKSPRESSEVKDQIQAIVEIIAGEIKGGVQKIGNPNKARRLNPIPNKLRI